MSETGGFRQLQFTVSPALDAALLKDWEQFSTAIEQETASKVSAWMARRIERPDLGNDLEHLVRDLVSNDFDRKSIAAVELAEMSELHDDALAEMLWNGALNIGLATNDGDLIFEAASRMAAIAEEDGDPMAVAEYFITFLNWRRQADHASDPDAVHEAFEGVIEAAAVDGQPDAVARFTFEQAKYGRVVEAAADSATVGDWIPDELPYRVWND